MTSAKHRRRNSVGLAVVFLLAGASCRQDLQRAKGAEPVNAKIESIGRFRIGTPEGLDVSSREQSIYAVKAWTAAPGWAARLSVLGDKIVSQPSLGDGAHAAWYEEDSVLLLEAEKVVGDYAVRLLRDAPAGKEPQAEKLVSNVMNGYRPTVETGFCIGAGAIRLGPAQLETTLLHWKSKSNPALKITFSTQTVEDPDRKQYMDVKEEEEVMRMVKGRLEVYRQEPRVLAGLEGMEIRLAMAPPGEPELVRYTWHYPGVGEDGTRPRINIVAFTSPERRGELDGIWEGLLQTLAQVPVGARQ